jgi:hypothetical protein
VAQLAKQRRGAMLVWRFQAFVNQALVCEGQIKGIPLPIERLPKKTAGAT